MKNKEISEWTGEWYVLLQFFVLKRYNIQLILVQILLTSMLIFVLNKTLLDFHNSSVNVIIAGIWTYNIDTNLKNIKRELKNNFFSSFLGCSSPWRLCKAAVSGQVEREITHLWARERETSMNSASIVNYRLPFFLIFNINISLRFVWIYSKKKKIWESTGDDQFWFVIYEFHYIWFYIIYNL